MTDTPLSDLMDAHVEANTPESYAALVEAFRDAAIGIVGIGFLEPDENGQAKAGPNFSTGRTMHGDGKPRILTYADPVVASQQPGSQCNAAIPGQVLLEMAASDPECEGILINSATEAISVIISKENAAAALEKPKKI